MAHYQPSETTLLFKCCYCDTTDTEVQIVSHLVRHHVKPELAPWRCGLCGFQTISRQALGHHVHHYQHVQEVKKRPGERSEFIMAKNPYTVKIGIDYMIVMDEHAVKKSCLASRKRKASPPDISAKRTHVKANTHEHIPTIDVNTSAVKPKDLEIQYPQHMKENAGSKHVTFEDQTQASGTSMVNKDRSWLTANWIINNCDQIEKTSTEETKVNAEEVPLSKLVALPVNEVPTGSAFQKTGSNGNERGTPFAQKTNGKIKRSGSLDTKKTQSSHKTTLKTKIADNPNKTNKSMKSSSHVSKPTLNQKESDKLPSSEKQNSRGHTHGNADKQKSKSRQKNVQTQTQKLDTAEVFEMNGRMLLDAINVLSAALQPLRRIEQAMVKQDSYLTMAIPLLQTVAMVLQPPIQLKDEELKDDIKGRCLQ